MASLEHASEGKRDMNSQFDATAHAAKDPNSGRRWLEEYKRLFSDLLTRLNTTNLDYYVVSLTNIVEEFKDASLQNGIDNNGKD